MYGKSGLETESPMLLQTKMLNLKILSRIRNFVIGCFTVERVIICGK